MRYTIQIYSRLQFCAHSWTSRANWTTWTCWSSRTVRWVTEHNFVLLDFTIWDCKHLIAIIQCSPSLQALLALLEFLANQVNTPFLD